LKGHAFFLPSLMMAGFVSAYGATPTPIVITSPIYAGATVVAGTAQKVDATYTDVAISLCVSATKESTKHCLSNRAPLTGGQTSVPPDAAGNFVATLQVSLRSGDLVYAIQSLSTGGRVVFLGLSFPQPVVHAPECISNALSGYTIHGTGQNACTIRLDRNNLATPPPITVPKGTVVSIELDNAHWNETIQFNRVTTKIADQDIAAAVLRQLLPNLQALAASVRSSNVTIAAGATPSPDDIDDAENKVQANLESALVTVTNANNDLTCFEGYRAGIKTNSPMAQCGSTILIGPIDGAPAQDTFSATKTNLLEELNTATTVGLGFTTLCSIPNLIAARQQACTGVTVAPPTPASGCRPPPPPLPLLLRVR
jgi:hypothetical protein